MKRKVEIWKPKIKKLLSFALPKLKPLNKPAAAKKPHNEERDQPAGKGGKTYAWPGSLRGWGPITRDID